MATGDLEFRVLGPLRVMAGSQPLSLGGRKPRMLLATLLLSPNRLVPTETLVDVLWPQSPPRSAVANVRTYVSSLRTGLRNACPHKGGPSRILAKPRGYTVLVEPTELDLLVVDDLAARAQRLRAAGELGEALELLGRASALTSGAPLEDLPPAPLWEPALRRIEERRLQLAEDRLAVQVALGQHSPAIAELRQLLAGQPFREGLWHQLMLALRAAGRDAEALQAYAGLRRRLVAELGAEPGPQLRRIHAEILAGQPSQQAPARGLGCQLPPATADFTGRETASRDLAALLCPHPHQVAPKDALGALDAPKASFGALPPGPASGAPVVAVVTGTPGVGKSALAVAVAHRLRPAFPDGQLYLDLTGGPAHPGRPRQLLAELLRALGVPAAAVPAGTDERAALYRATVADRRILLLLDNASGAAQLRLLLPAASGCAVLVTSRRRLDELPGARHIELDVLTTAQAHRLLGSIAGAARLAGEPAAAARIVTACGRLPLALRIAGARLAARPVWTVHTLAERLADPARRLGELRLGELSVQDSFAASQRTLTAPAARALGLLGLLGHQAQPEWVVAALVGRRHAAESVEELVDANLLRPVGTGAHPRYQLPDLLRCYALHTALDSPEPRWRAALHRVSHGWLGMVLAANRGLPVTIFATTGSFTALAPPQAVEDSLAWFDAERAALVGAVELAAAHAPAELACTLAVALVPYFDLRGHYDDWERTHQLALQAARRAQDRRATALLLRGLGQLALYRDHYRQARQAFTGSRELFEAIGDEHGAALAVCGLAALARVRGRGDEAFAHQLAALSVFRAAGDRHAEAYTRNAIGTVRLGQRRHDEALVWFAAALRLSRQLGDEHREAHVLHQLGVLHGERDRPAKAMSCLQRALSVFQRIGDTHGEAYVLRAIGEVHAAAGQPGHGLTPVERALALCQRLGDRHGEATAAQVLGGLHHRERHPDQAERQLSHALGLWRALRAAPHP